VAMCSALRWPRALPLGGRRDVRAGGGEPYELANPTAAAIYTAKGAASAATIAGEAPTAEVHGEAKQRSKARRH
jgi:hypothetical protein